MQLNLISLLHTPSAVHIFLYLYTANVLFTYTYFSAKVKFLTLSPPFLAYIFINFTKLNSFGFSRYSFMQYMLIIQQKNYKKHYKSEENIRQIKNSFSQDQSVTTQNLIQW